MKKNFASTYAKVEAACDGQPKGAERFACRQKAYAKAGIEITPAKDEATGSSAAASGAPTFATFASGFQAGLVAGNSTNVLAAMAFPVSVTVHPLSTADGKNFTVGAAVTKSYDRATWEKVATCGFPENGDTFPNTPQGRCDLFYAYSGMAGLSPGTLVVDEGRHTIQTAGYDSSKAVNGLSMAFSDASGAWLLTSVHETFYTP